MKEPAINTLADLVNSGLTWGSRSGWDQYFAGFNEELINRIYTGFIFVKGFNHGFQRVAEGDYAFMNSESALR